MSTKIVEDSSLRSKRYVFKDRVHAGELLAKKLEKYKDEDVIILAIPSGGVPVGFTIAKEIKKPFDLIIVRKIPIPMEPEAGFGAMSFDGNIVLNETLVERLGLTKEEIDECSSQVLKEIRRRMDKFRGDKPFPDLKDKTVIIVDDGLASGYTMLAAIKSVKKQSVRKIIVAVPTASTNAINLIAPHVDEIFCLNIRDSFFFAVADAYKNWYDLNDDEVQGYLRRV
ncbi:MAG: phosphoribosyltransferase [archaeon]|nr:phosphoribosyltransferase [archaeon]